MDIAVNIMHNEKPLSSISDGRYSFSMSSSKVSNHSGGTFLNKNEKNKKISKKQKMNHKKKEIKWYYEEYNPLAGKVKRKPPEKTNKKWFSNNRPDLWLLWTLPAASLPTIKI